MIIINNKQTGLKVHTKVRSAGAVAVRFDCCGKGFRCRCGRGRGRGRVVVVVVVIGCRQTLVVVVVDESSGVSG